MADRFGQGRWVVGLVAGFLLMGIPPLGWAASDNLQIRPSAVKIGVFFAGARLTVSGEIPRGSDAVIEILGKTSVEDLMRKGKRWELWMNVGEVDVQGAPSFYLLQSSRPEPIAASSAHPRWGYEALKQKISFGALFKESTDERLFREFIRLKKSQGVYGVDPQGVTLTPSNDGRNRAEAVFTIPPRVVPGTYRVCLFAVQNGRVVQRQCAPLQVKVIGFPAFLASMARTHMVLYGFMAVFIAMGAGLLTGVIFKKKGGHH
jgi:hypothetical protein